MRRLLLITILLVLSQISYALSETDFAYGYTLEVDGDGAIYSLSLPEDVYHGLTRADRGDLRVFNSQGVVVPHYIKRAEMQHRQEQPPVSLPIFPLYAENSNSLGGDGYHVHVVTDDKGAIIDINYGKAGTDTSRRISAYLVDCSQLKLVPNALQLNWPESTGDFVFNILVEGSDDLNHWTQLVSRSTLSNLHYAGHTLIQQRIELPLRKQKYLRLSWTDDKSLMLSGVMALFPTSSQSQERKWSSFAVTNKDTEHHYYYFDTHSVLPADRVNIDLPQRNSLVTVSLASAANAKGPWYPRYHGLLYNLQFEGKRLITPDQVMSVTTHRYWRLRILNQEAKLDGEPTLRLGWIPEQLYFIAQGEAPFTLAYGSARVGPMDTSLAQLLSIDKIQDQQQLIKAAQLGSRIALGNRDKLKPLRRPADWKQIVLWLVLIFGVAALAYMALRLYKQIDQARPNE